MRLKAKEEKNICFSSKSRGFKKYMLVALGLAGGSYIVSDSIFSLDEEHDAIIVNRLWGEKRLIEEEGFHLKFPFVESKYLIRNLYDLDLLNSMVNELKEDIKLESKYEFNLPSTQEMMKVYEVDSKEELYRKIWDDISFFLMYGVSSPQLHKILVLYLENLTEKCKAAEPFLEENFKVINDHHNDKFSIEFKKNKYAEYDITTNTLRVPYLNMLQTFFYSLAVSDLEFIKVGKVKYDREILTQFYINALIGEAQLIEALVHESIHAQSIMDESITMILTHLAFTKAAKIDKDFELYAKISIYLTLLNTLSLLGAKNVEKIKDVSLPSREMSEEFYYPYTLGWYEKLATSLLTDGLLFVPEKKMLIDISSLKPYFSKLEELKK